MPQTVMRTSFKVKRSKVKVTRPITAETENVSYQQNGKAYELQNCYADGACYQLPRPAIKAITLDYCTRAGAYRVGRTRWPQLVWLSVPA